MDQVTTDTVLSLAFRHLVGAGAGALIAAGYSAGYTNEQITGAAMLGGAILLSWWNKRGYAIAMGEVAKVKALVHAGPVSPAVNLQEPQK